LLDLREPLVRGREPWFEGGFIDPLPAPNAGRTASAVMAQMPERVFVIEDLVLVRRILIGSASQPNCLLLATTVLPYLFPMENKNRDARRVRGANGLAPLASPVLF